MRERASARMTAFGELEIRTGPYSDRTALFVADLKASIPGLYRAWDDDDKVWRVKGAYREQALAVLLAHFPNAETPDDAPRRRPSTPARTEKPAPELVPLPPLPTLAVEVSPEQDDPTLDHLVASIHCPTCRRRHDQSIRVTVQTGERVARAETITPELVAVCPHCRHVLVVGFVPALVVDVAA